MKRGCTALALLALLLGAAIGQTSETSGYSLRFLLDAKDANQVWGTVAFFPGQKFIDIWSATIRKLIVDHKRILIADRVSGFISAEDSIVDVQYFIEECTGGIQVTFPSAGGQKAIEKIARKVCDSIIEQLVDIK